MKRMSIWFMLSLTILTVIGTACSQVLFTNTGSSTQSLSQAGQLLVGTMKLEGTKNAMDAQEAASLLPLWQAYRQLSQSNTTAQAEVTAVVSQIQSSMTSNQIQAIKTMNLRPQDLTNATNSLGEVSSALRSTSSAASGGNTSGSGISAGGDPQSVGGGPVPGGDALSGSLSGTGTSLSSSTPTSTQQATTVGSNGISTSLVTALIELLQKRVGSLAG